MSTRCTHVGRMLLSLSQAPQPLPKDQVCGGYDHRTGSSYGAAVRLLQGCAIASAAKEFDMISRHGWLTSLSIERLWPNWLLCDLARVWECSNHILKVWSYCQSHVSKVYWIMCAYTRCFGADACHVNVSEMNLALAVSGSRTFRGISIHGLYSSLGGKHRRHAVQSTEALRIINHQWLESERKRDGEERVSQRVLEYQDEQGW